MCAIIWPFFEGTNLDKHYLYLVNLFFSIIWLIKTIVKMSAYLLVPSSAGCLPYRYQRIDHLARLHHSSPDHSDKHPLRLTLIRFQTWYHDGQYCLNVALEDQSTRSEGSRKSCLHSSLLSGSVEIVTLGIVWQPLRRPCYLKSMAVNFPHVSL